MLSKMRRAATIYRFDSPRTWLNAGSDSGEASRSRRLQSCRVVAVGRIDCTATFSLQSLRIHARFLSAQARGQVEDRFPRTVPRDLPLWRYRPRSSSRRAV